jgi:leucine-rich repeat-containing protein 49
VLNLGNNEIERIEGLDHLLKLDALDLHGNKISKLGLLYDHLCDVLENLRLPELRVLNISGNQIRVIENLQNLESLVELNARQNKASKQGCIGDSIA